jgi:hypothetical protein
VRDKEMDETISINLWRIKLIKISKGGYNIRFSGSLPSEPYKIMFYLPATQCSIVPDDAIDVTESIKKKRNKVTNAFFYKINTSKKLSEILKLIDKNKRWGGGEVDCCLYLTQESKIVTTSNYRPLKCPVKPIDGSLRPKLEEEDPVHKLEYAGTRQTGGSWLHQPDIDGKFYFTHKGWKFRTSDEKRGFNCITYVGAIFKVPAKEGHMTRGDKLITHENINGKIKVGYNGVKRRKVIQFFSKKENKTGTFIMWKKAGEGTGHVVLVDDLIVHEFNIKPKNGYNKSWIGPKGEEGSLRRWRGKGGEYKFYIAKVPEDKVKWK